MTAPMKEPPAPPLPADLDAPLPLSPTPRVLLTSGQVVPGLAPRPFAGFERDLVAGPAAVPPGAGSAVASFGCSALAGVFLMGFVATSSHTSGVPRSYRLERERAIEAARVERTSADAARPGLARAITGMGPRRPTVRPGDDREVESQVRAEPAAAQEPAGGSASGGGHPHDPAR